MIRSMLRGAAAGAAGATALNTVTYVDMTLRARPASSTPQKTIEAAADKAHVDVPGTGDDRQNRISALGSLTGLVTGVAVGTGYGMVRGLGLRLPLLGGAGLAAAAAMLLANGPMAALRVTDPREWSATEWAADVVPHLAYGLVTAWTYDART